MAQQNVEVFVRGRPLSNDEQPSLQYDATNSTITAKSKNYYFKKVFNQNATQESVFHDVGLPIVDGFVNGINGTIFAYGQTGSGKTYTMLGRDNAEDHGIIRRGITRVFELLTAEKKETSGTFKFTLKCSSLQIHDEKLFDLFQKNASVKIQADDEKVTVKGAAEIQVYTGEECMERLQQSLSQRKTAETLMNLESSRSHAVFMLSLETETCVNGITKKRSSRLYMVDLAGSERQSDTRNTGLRLQEAGDINNSLSVLARVIRDIIDKKNFIPYRHSKLTLLLRDSLGGNSKTTVLVNVHSDARYIDQTVSTLEFAKNVKQVRNTTKINEQLSCKEVDSLKVVNGDLQRENERLQTEASDLTKKLTNQEDTTKFIEAKLLECQKEATKSLQEKDDKIKQLQTDDNAKTFKIQEKDEEIQQLRTLMAKLQLDNAIMNATIDLLDKTLLR